MNGKSTYTIVPPPARAVQDEWGMFDPNQAGLKAAFRAVKALNTPSGGDALFEPAEESDGAEASIAPEDAAPAHDAAEPIRISAVERPSRENHFEPRATGPTRIVSHVAALDDSVYDPTDPQPRVRQHKPVEKGAVYTLEFSTRCPQCCSEITTVRVSRLMRTQVSFTSTLPRKGYIIVCPECEGILSAELSGLI